MKILCPGHVYNDVPVAQLVQQLRGISAELERNWEMSVDLHARRVADPHRLIPDPRNERSDNA